MLLAQFGSESAKVVGRRHACPTKVAVAVRVDTNFLSKPATRALRKHARFVEKILVTVHM
jgi:hypothetical protein